ncbi:LacI family transcriptional regulator [Bombiscardovia nodaiensis]|uniref:LacI family transcriptional regulator n=1 Tax=Bombiscardovia nodaiensis TaxID=2932181 RepID=A0ABM8B7S1_9BIFI|nr:LacI family transcriptional regulator [Bombiscardovia nodaiensis]
MNETLPQGAANNTGTSPRSQDSEVTLTEVAERAGVSLSTASRVFARPGRVSIRTRQRVLAVAQAMGYQSSSLDAPVSNGLQGSLAIVVTDLENIVSARIARGLQEACYRRNFGVNILDTEESSERELLALRRILPHVDGAVLGSSRLSDTAIRRFAQSKPLVVLNRVVPGVASIFSNDAPAIQNVVRDLDRLGHRSIAYLPGPENSWQNVWREKALSQACQEAGITFRRMPCAYPVASQAAKSFHYYSEHPTSAVLAFNDDIAIAFLQFVQAQAQNSSSRLDRNIAIVGIDDIPGCQLVTPQLSSVHVEHRKMGMLAADMLIDTVVHAQPHSLDHQPLGLVSQYSPRGTTRGV